MLVKETEIDFKNARALLEEGLVAVHKGDGEIDLQNVKKVDSSAIALALDWLRCAEKLGKPLKLINRPDSFNKLIELYGLSKVFE